MSQKLHQALKELKQSIDNFEKNYFVAESRPRRPVPSLLDQHDLFGLSQDRSKDIKDVLDRTISKMEKLVEETANG